MNLHSTPTPTEDLAAIGQEWKRIESMIQRNLERGTFPFQVICFNNDYSTLKNVAESLGLYVRGLRNKATNRKVIVCESKLDKRSPKNFKVTVGSANCYSIEEIGPEGRNSTLTEIPIAEGSSTKIALRTMLWTWTLPTEPEPKP